MADSSKIAKGGALGGLAALITAVAALVGVLTSDAGDKADRADYKTEAGFTRIKLKFESVEKDVKSVYDTNMQQHQSILKLIESNAELRAQVKIMLSLLESRADHAHRTAASRSGGNPLASLDKPAPSPKALPEPAPIQQKVVPLPDKLEDIISKK